MKSYTAQTGVVYQYYFVGRRASLPGAPEGPATEFVFDVSSDRKLMVAVSVFLQDQALAAWARDHQRQLSEAEQYAAAKLRLFQGFGQERNLVAAGAARLVLDAAALEELLASIGVE